MKKHIGKMLPSAPIQREKTCICAAEALENHLPTYQRGKSKECVQQPLIDLLFRVSLFQQRMECIRFDCQGVCFVRDSREVVKQSRQDPEG